MTRFEILTKGINLFEVNLLLLKFKLEETNFLSEQILPVALLTY